MGQLLILSAVALLLAGTNVFEWRTILQAPSVRVEELDVGKGTALLAMAPGGHAVLIDAGPDVSVLRALGEALPPWKRHLDALIIENASALEEGGAPFVLERYQTDYLLRTSEEGAPTREAALASAASAAYGLSITTIPRGARVYLSVGTQTLELSASTTPGTYPVEPR